jgi:hypothetical protein
MDVVIYLVFSELAGSSRHRITFSSSSFLCMLVHNHTCACWRTQDTLSRAMSKFLGTTGEFAKHDLRPRAPDAEWTPGTARGRRTARG